MDVDEGKDGEDAKDKNGKEKMEISVVESLKGKIGGLCGPYNDDGKDDWLLGPSTICTAPNAPAPGTQVDN